MKPKSEDGAAHQLVAPAYRITARDEATAATLAAIMRNAASETIPENE